MRRSVGWTSLGCTFALLASPAFSQPVVGLDTGRVQGTVEGGVVRYAGLPYASPPVGALRWRPSQPARAWAGVRRADHFGPLCMQKIVVDNGIGPGPTSEDCLTLNVYAPVGARQLPVMVWIHGGGLVNGSGTAALYDGAALARQGVVVVTLNYRLGRLGFFAHPAVTADAHGEPVANYGLMDQVAALQWVHRNVEALGGNPSAVTIFGESAGGTSVNRLMMMTRARGLFSRAISESGLGAEHGQSLAEAEADGAAFAERAGLPDATAAALRALPAEALLADPPLSMSKGEAPILDGQLLTEDPLPAFQAGHEAQVPYLVGSNGLEVPKMWTVGFKDAIHFSPTQVEGLKAAYGSAGLYDTRILTDAVFGAPGRALARAHSAHGAPTYLYRFSVAPPSEMATYGGAIHASDRQYVFQTLSASVWPTTANDAAQARTISAYWTAFARAGNPNGGDRPVWPAYGGSDQMMVFANEGPEAQAAPDAHVLDVISAYQAADPGR